MKQREEDRQKILQLQDALAHSQSSRIEWCRRAKVLDFQKGESPWTPVNIGEFGGSQNATTAVLEIHLWYGHTANRGGWRKHWVEFRLPESNEVSLKCTSVTMQNPPAIYSSSGGYSQQVFVPMKNGVFEVRHIDEILNDSMVEIWFLGYQ